MDKHVGRTVITGIMILIIWLGGFVLNFSPDAGAGYYTEQYRQSENIRFIIVATLLTIVSALIIWWRVIFPRK